jgi:hypothetical protein
VPLPVGRLAASPRAQGTLLVLEAFGRRARTHLDADYSVDRVTLTQISF